MLIVSALAAFQLAGAAAGPDPAWYRYRSHDVAAAQKAGCIVRPQPAPSGKTVPTEPLILCRRGAGAQGDAALARRSSRPELK